MIRKLINYMLIGSLGIVVACAAPHHVPAILDCPNKVALALASSTVQVGVMDCFTPSFKQLLAADHQVATDQDFAKIAASDPYIPFTVISCNQVKPLNAQFNIYGFFFTGKQSYSSLLLLQVDKKTGLVNAWAWTQYHCEDLGTPL